LIFGLITYVLLLKGREIGFKSTANCFVYGVLLSCVIGLIRHIFWQSTVPRAYAVELLRFSALTGNPNNLYPFVLCAMCCVFVLNFNAKFKWREIAILSALSAFGFLTISRGFIMFLVPLVLISLSMLLIKHKTPALTRAACILGAVILGGLCVFPYTITGFARTFSPETEFEIAADMQTPEDKLYDPGRWGIWKKNLNEWTSSPRNFFIGQNFTAPDIWNMNPHNFIILILIKTGLVGLLLFAAFLAMIFVLLYKRKQKFSLPSFLFLFVILLDLIETNFPRFGFFMFIFFFILATKETECLK
jgi:hypothetical protein